MSCFLMGVDFIFECNSRLFHAFTSFIKEGPVTQRIRHLTTNQEVQILAGSLLFWVNNPMDFFYHLNRLSPSYEARYHIWGVVMFATVALLHLLSKSIECLSNILRLLWYRSSFSKMQPLPVELWCLSHLLVFPSNKKSTYIKPQHKWKLKHSCLFSPVDAASHDISSESVLCYWCALLNCKELTY